jgi:tRNA(Ile)-lysidine synthase TilS/MesJ
MRCYKCRNEAIFFQPYSGRHLCSRHLTLDIEARSKRSIRSHRWIQPGDHIAVLVSDDRKSAALLCFLKKLTADRRDIRLSAVPACERDLRTGCPSAAVKVAETLRVPCIELSLPGASVTAAEGTVTRVAMAVSLDDIAQGVLGQFLFGIADRLVHPPADEGNHHPVIYPFIAVPSAELDLYWAIEGSGIDIPPVTPCRDAVVRETGALLEDFSRRHPATKYALLHLAEQLGPVNAAAGVLTGSCGPCAGERRTSPQKRPNS